MCCVIIHTDVLLSLLARVCYDYTGKYEITYEQLEGFLDELRHEFPTYVVSDLSLSSIYYTIEEYPELYKLSWKTEQDELDYKAGKLNENFIIMKDKLVPNLDYFLHYNTSTKNLLRSITEEYVKDNS